MNTILPRLLTWGTLTAAIAGAMWLSNAEAALPDTYEMNDVLSAMMVDAPDDAEVGGNAMANRIGVLESVN